MHKNTIQKNTRVPGIDIVKILACLFVTSVHFFLHSGFYFQPLSSDFGIPQVVLRWITFLCVPLFMITTGYVMRNKTLSAKYYTGILRILILYLVISAIIIPFKIFYHKLEFTVWTAFRAVLNFTAVDYAWYVEYYITLFLLIPFINAAYNSMKTRSKRLFMLLTVFLLTSVSQSVFIGDVRETQIRVFPGCYLQGLNVSYYPFVYYLIGMYIRDYPPRLGLLKRKLLYFILFAGSIAFLTVTTWDETMKSEKLHFISWHFDSYGSVPVVIAGTALFLLLYDIPCKNKPLQFILKTMSNATFCAFLLSYIFDSFAYRVLYQKAETVPERFRYAPLVILFVFGGSILSGIVIQGLYNLSEAAIRKLRTKKHAPNANVQS